MKNRLLKFIFFSLAVCSALCVLIACGVEFKVNFIVDGEVYSAIDTKGGETIKMPDNPAKENYIFDGWFWDKDVWEKPFTANSLLDAPLSSDMSVYAKFTKKHEHSYTATTTDPTCTDRGFTTYTCDCGDSFVDSYTDALDHDYNALITAPTCSEQGYTTHTCSHCGDSFVDSYTNALDHDYNALITAPTCTEQGYTTHTCSRCGDSFVDSYTDALDHEFINYVSDNNATYDSDGTKTAHCNRGCGATDTLTDGGTKLKSEIAFKTLSINGNNVYGKSPNEQTTFSFIDEVEIKGNATFVVSSDIYGIQQIPTKTVPLIEGDNTFYITETVDNNIRLFTVVIRRIPVYIVSFYVNGGSAVISQSVEEDCYATEPTTTRAGYSFAGWDYDFNTPITDNTEIMASWTAHTDTPYKAEYYLQNLEDDNYTLQESDTGFLTGTTDTTAYAEIKIFEHFTHTLITQSLESGNINGDGSTVLKMYYTRDKYDVNISATDNVTLSDTYSGQYKYGYPIGKINATFNNYIGYEWTGWFNGEEFISAEKFLPAMIVDKDINYSARCSIKEEMSNFSFSSTEISCSITGIKDRSVTEIIVPDYVTHITSGTFGGCSMLKRITIPFVGAKAGVTASDIYQFPFGYIFSTFSGSGRVATTQYYYYLSTGSTISSTYYIPSSLESVTVTGGNILYGAFYNCSRLKSITISDSVISIGENAFYGCSRLNYNQYDNAYYLGNENNPYVALIKANNTSITSCIINAETKVIYHNAFSGCNDLTSIVIPDSVTSIGMSAFNGCRSLNYNKYDNSYYLGNENNPYIALIKAKDKSITSCIINEKTKVIYDYAFERCSSLTSITIPDSVTSIGEYAFYGCSSLTSVTISDSVTSIGDYAFYDCSELTSVYYDGDIVGWCNICFAGFCANPLCNGAELYINENGEYILVTELVIPDTVKVIKQYAFLNCSSLTSVTIPNSVTSIGKGAFYKCGSLTSVTIGNGVMIIGDYAFYDCSNLANINFNGTIAEWNKIQNWGFNNVVLVKCSDGIC